MGDTFDDYLSGFTPQRASVTICLRGDLAEELHRLGDELAKARKEDDARGTISGNAAPAIEERISQLEVERNLALREFTFEALGEDAWASLIKKHPPTEEGAAWGEGFSGEAIQVSCVKPRMTAEQCTRLRQTLNHWQWIKLFRACCDANTGDDPGPKSPLGSPSMNGSATRPTSAAETESPVASS